MPKLIVEDGEMPKGANSYASVEQADAYHALRRTEAWPLHDPDTSDPDPALEQKQAALVLATDYLNGLAWKGSRVAPGRVMAWPRKNVIDADIFELGESVVPDGVMLACCALAGLVMDGTNLQPVLDRGGRTSSEGSGILASSYFDDAVNRDIYTVVADLLYVFVEGFGRFAGTGDNKAGKGAGTAFGKVQVG